MQIRLTADEHAKLSAMAERDRRALADWIRVVALEAATRKRRASPAPEQEPSG